MSNRLFSATSVKIVLATAGAILVGAAVAEAFDKPKATTKKVYENNPSPYRWDAQRARSVVSELAGTERDKAFIACEAAARLFGQHPSGKTATFPPEPNALPGVNCVWALTVDMVEKTTLLQARAPRPFVWTVRQATDEGYPWDEPSLHPGNYPTPGMFFDAGRPTNTGDTVDADHDLDKTVRRALASALVMAKMNPALAEGTSNTSKRLRREMRQLVVGSKFHDTLYGQTDLDKAGGDAYVLNEYGRSLNWLPVHADNITLISQGRAPRRTTSADGEPLTSSQHEMLLWIPAVDLAALSDAVPNVRPFVWPDGTSTQEPPPSIARLGIEAAS